MPESPLYCTGGILDSTGASVVTYNYDAWGRLLATGGSMAATLGKLNPFRYRGYVYDEETGLYYLRSRYYNPEWGRFINADTLLGKVGALGSHNLFAYCLNNPASRYDQNGRMSVAIQAVEGVLQNSGVYQMLDDILDAANTVLKAAIIWATGILVNTLANAQTKPRTKAELKNALVSVESPSYAGGRDPHYPTEDYYFAFVLRDLDSENGFRNFGYLVYIDVPLSKEEALIVLASEEIISALMQEHKFFSNAYGIYTDYNWEAYDLSMATGGSLFPECHIDTNRNLGEYYWHYHAFNPVSQDTPHIWFGTPSFKLY